MGDVMKRAWVSLEAVVTESGGPDGHDGGERSFEFVEEPMCSCSTGVSAAVSVAHGVARVTSTGLEC